MSKIVVAVVGILLLAAAAAFFYFSGKEYTVRIPEEEIREKMNEKLPLTKTYFIFLDLTLDNPRVELKEGSNRVHAGLDATLNIKLNKNPKPLGGTIDASGGVEYRRESGEFFLTDPVIENLAIQGIPEKHTDKVKEAASKLLTKWYSENPIYSLSSLDTKRAAAKMLLKSVLVENKELVITLGI